MTSRTPTGSARAPSPAGVAALVLAAANTRPDAVFLEDADAPGTVTFGQLAERFTALGALLDGATSPGHAVAVAMRGSLDYAVALLAVVGHGRRCVPLDPNAPAADLARTLRATSTGTLLGDLPAGVVRALAGLADDVTVLDPASTGRAAATAPGDAPERPGALVLATSGSTGTPKVVELSEARLLHVARTVARHNALTPADCGYNTLPLFHVNAEVVAVLASLVAGARLVLRARFSRRAFWADLERTGATWVNAVPAILAILATEEPPALPGLRFVRSASAPLPAPTRRRVEQRLGVPVVESYGMTEAASQITVAPLDGSAPFGSAGRPAGTEVQIRRPDGAPADVDEVGRVWIRGEGVITSYVGGRAADRFDADGWLDTGDLGHLDGDGFLFLAGRSDDVINRGGEMVHPAGIEAVLLADHRVREAVVVGVPDDILGSVPEAFVVAADDVDPEGLCHELAEHCARQLPRPWRPQAIHLVTDLPRAATGKIVRREVRAAVLDEAAGR